MEQLLFGGGAFVRKHETVVMSDYTLLVVFIVRVRPQSRVTMFLRQSLQSYVVIVIGKVGMARVGIQPESGPPFEDCLTEIPLTVAAKEEDTAGDVDLSDAGVEFLGFCELSCGEVDDCRIVHVENTVHGVRVAKLRPGQSIVWIQLDRLLQ